MGCLEKELTELGTHLAVDAKALRSFGRKPSDAKREAPDGRRDTDADWGTKTYKGLREDGSVWEKVKRWFGYKVHLVVDADYELPLAYTVSTPSSTPPKGTCAVAAATCPPTATTPTRWETTSPWSSRGSRPSADA